MQTGEAPKTQTIAEAAKELGIGKNQAMQRRGGGRSQRYGSETASSCCGSRSKKCSDYQCGEVI